VRFGKANGRTLERVERWPHDEKAIDLDACGGNARAVESGRRVDESAPWGLFPSLERRGLSSATGSEGNGRRTGAAARDRKFRHHSTREAPVRQERVEIGELQNGGWKL
jgi:hypothetical protein